MGENSDLLFPQPEFANDRQVAFPVGLPEVLQKVRALAHELEEPAPTGEVLRVCSHVPGQLIDTSREQRDLHLGRAAILLVPTELADKFGLPLLRDRHLSRLREFAASHSCLQFTKRRLLHALFRIYAIYQPPTRWQGDIFLSV
jgi:hypothetical protein